MEANTFTCSVQWSMKELRRLRDTEFQDVNYAYPFLAIVYCDLRNRDWVEAV